MAERERRSGRQEARSSVDRGQALESMVRFRSGQAPSLLDPGFDPAGAELLDESGGWEQSGISRVPREWQSEPEDAHREIERLNSILAQLRSERDQALWNALTVELDLGEQIESSRREAREARQRADRAVRRQHELEQNCKAKLARFEQQIADLRERLTACGELLSSLEPRCSPDCSDSVVVRRSRSRMTMGLIRPE
jgi:hypothetical protein